MTGERLTELYNYFINKKTIKNKKEFSNLIGIDERNLNKYLTNTISLTITPSNYDTIQNLNINIGWLLTGQGPMFLSDAIHVAEKPVESEKDKRIRELETELSNLKKMVGELEKENSESAKELLERIKELTSLKDKYINVLEAKLSTK